MTHIEAMKQALDALGAYMGATDKEEDEKAHSLMAAAFFKLKEAIAEAEKQEPYAYTYLGIKADDSQHGPHLCWKPEYMDAMSASKGAVAIPLYTHPQPKAEQA